jgi:hypothetical protein
METLVERLIKTQRDPSQVPHISPSSITSFMKCPRQWQETYIFGRRGTSNNSLVIGSAVHLALSRLFQGEQVGDYWNETIASDERNGPIDWKKDTPEGAQKISEAMIYHYWTLVGKFLKPLNSEMETTHYVDGVEIGILGIPDLVTADRIIDFKTTAYFRGINKDWVIQQAIYQLFIDLPSEIHVLSRGKTPLYVPASTDDKLHLGRLNKENTLHMVRAQWDLMRLYWEKYGENPWPGNQIHEYAEKYCGLKNCCKL